MQTDSQKILQTITKPIKNNQSKTSNEEREEDIVLFFKYADTKIYDKEGKLKTSDKVLRNRLADRNCKLVTYVVNKFYNKKKEHKQLREDLLQEGSLGLLSAIDGFDPTLGFKFSTYATWWIRQSINNYLLSQDPHLHVPSHIRTAQNKVLKKMKELDLGFRDLIEENAEALGITQKMLDSINASLKSKWVSSLEETTHQNHLSRTGADQDMTLKDMIADEDAIQSENKTDHNTLIKAVHKGLMRLSERERFIVLLRYNIIQSVDERKQ